MRESFLDLPPDCLEAFEELLRKCVIDPLLGIPNRLYFEVFGKREISIGRRLGVPLSLLFIDVDNLKKVNDTYGHLAGDRYLKEVVKRIKPLIRESDLLIRWGGDEFVVILHTDEAGSLIVKDRIESRVNGSCFLLGGERVKISLSIGWAEIKDSILPAVALADSRMYEEKKLRKGRVKM